MLHYFGDKLRSQLSTMKTLKLSMHLPEFSHLFPYYLFEGINPELYSIQFGLKVPTATHSRKDHFFKMWLMCTGALSILLDRSANE